MKMHMNGLRRNLVRLLPACTLVLLACGLFGGGAENGGDSPPEGGSQPVATASGGSDGLPDESVVIGAAFWHSGFRVELNEARFYGIEDDFTDEITYYVSISAQFENLGSINTFFDGEVALVTDAGASAAFFTSDVPNVPAGLSTPGEFLFEMDAGFDFSGARVLVGTPDEHRAQIPLGPEGGELVSLEPSELTLSGSISMALIDLQFTGAELRADRPDVYEQVDAGKLALTLFFDATSRASGNWSLLPQDFSLTLPGGGVAAPEWSELGSLPGTEEGIDTGGLFVRFLVDDPPAGTYTLRFAPGSWFVGADGVAEGAFEFTIP